MIIAKEMLHHFKYRKAQKGAIAWKINLEKAYDKINWKFIKSVLQEVGFPSHWVNFIMSCVTSPKLSVLWNGEQSDMFVPQRGIRQGDPLSPYLFVLCVEKLAPKMNKEVTSRKFKPIKPGISFPPISHFFFADDLLLFGEATEDQTRVMIDCLEKFCSASGQPISKAKSFSFLETLL